MSRTIAKRGDVGVVFRYPIVLDKPVDFYDANAFWKIKSKETNEETSAQCTILTPAKYNAPRRTMLLEYTTVDGDLDTYGWYFVEWELLWSDGRRMSFPRTGHDYLLIYQDIENSSEVSIVPLQTEEGIGIMITTEDGRPIWIRL